MQGTPYGCHSVGSTLQAQLIVCFSLRQCGDQPEPATPGCNKLTQTAQLVSSASPICCLPQTSNEKERPTRGSTPPDTSKTNRLCVFPCTMQTNTRTGLQRPIERHAPHNAELPVAHSAKSTASPTDKTVRDKTPYSMLPVTNVSYRFFRNKKDSN